MFLKNYHWFRDDSWHIPNILGNMGPSSALFENNRLLLYVNATLAPGTSVAGLLDLPGGTMEASDVKVIEERDTLMEDGAQESSEMDSGEF